MIHTTNNQVKIEDNNILCQEKGKLNGKISEEIKFINEYNFSYKTNILVPQNSMKIQSKNMINAL